MTATTLDSAIFRDIFTTPEMRQVFSDEQRTANYLEIERALAKVQGRLGIIPEEAMHEIVKKCDVKNIDFA
jgi:3-carboxy-cis,cis-muconate cycloisomerase